MEKLTPQEQDAMQAVWQVGAGTIKEYRAKYPKPRPPYTTLASTVKKLEKKGYVTSRPVGNTLLYEPLVDEEQYKRRFMKAVVQDYFANSYKQIVNFLVENEKLSAEDLKDILRLIEENDKT